MSITVELLGCIKKKGRGYVFTQRDLLEVSNRGTVDKLLGRFCEREEIVNLGWGLYEYPKKNKKPELKSVIRALEVQFGETLQYNGEYACFLFGIRKKLSAEIVYLSAKKSRVVEVAGYKIRIKKTAIEASKKKGDKVTLVLQAMKYLGNGNVADVDMNKMMSYLDDKEKTLLVKRSRDVADWVYRVVLERGTQCVGRGPRVRGDEVPGGDVKGKRQA